MNLVSANANKNEASISFLNNENWSEFWSDSFIQTPTTNSNELLITSNDKNLTEYYLNNKTYISSNMLTIKNNNYIKLDACSECLSPINNSLYNSNKLTLHQEQNLYHYQNEIKSNKYLKNNNNNNFVLKNENQLTNNNYLALINEINQKNYKCNFHSK